MIFHSYFLCRRDYKSNHKAALKIHPDYRYFHCVSALSTEGIIPIGTTFRVSTGHLTRLHYTDYYTGEERTSGKIGRVFEKTTDYDNYIRVTLVDNALQPNKMEIFLADPTEVTKDEILRKLVDGELDEELESIRNKCKSRFGGF